LSLLKKKAMKINYDKNGKYIFFQKRCFVMTNFKTLIFLVVVLIVLIVKIYT